MAIDRNADWNYTQLVRDAIQIQNRPRHFEETTALNPDVRQWQGREIIGRDTKINGGVYMVADYFGQPRGEACVVDEMTQPPLQTCYQKLLTRAADYQKKTGMATSQFLLNMTMDLVEEVMPYNAAFVDKVVATYTPGTKISLGSYVDHHAGVCRHQALLAGYMLEKAIQEGYLRGRVSVDRNFIPGEGGHAWVRYTNAQGQIYILDAAQHFRGTLEEANRLAHWDYRRSEDMVRPKVEARAAAKPSNELAKKIFASNRRHK